VLELENIEMQYLTLKALKGIHLTIQEGEVVGYIGPNGAGKTTTLNIVSTLLKPTKGAVRLLGKNAFEDIRYSRSIIGYMPELFGVYDDMKVSEYLQFFCKAYQINLSKAAHIMNDSLSEIGLSEIASNPISSLSKGMKQKLFFMKTFIHSPKLVLLDEPFSGLDPIACKIVKEKVAREARNGTGFLIASHNLAELQEIVSRVVGLKGGILAADSPIADLGKEFWVYEIKVSGNADGAASLLSARFAGYKLNRRGPDGFLLEVPKGNDGKEILAAIVDAGLPLTLFSRREISLKEYFEKELGDARTN